jgi:adenylylsulfate kinase
MVVWMIGLSGAGKTTLAREVVARVKRMAPNVVLIDGDAVREMWGDDLGHGLDGRRRNAERIARLCKFLDDQDLHVVCAILSLFPESRDWNRHNLKRYYEVFIDTPKDALIERDGKGLYARFLKGEIRDVAGMDLPFPPPENPDLVIRNDGTLEGLLGHADAIARKVTGDR